jgi:sec-independent protein translocase protein TatA
MFGIGPGELLIVGIIAVILFGNRLPSVARSLGKSMTEFKRGMREFENEMHSTIYTDPPNRVTYNEQSEKKSPQSETAAAPPAAPAETAAAAPTATPVEG